MYENLPILAQIAQHRNERRCFAGAGRTTDERDHVPVFWSANFFITIHVRPDTMPPLVMLMKSNQPAIASSENTSAASPLNAFFACCKAPASALSTPTQLIVPTY